MDTDSFIVYIKTEDIYRDIVKDFKTRIDTSNYELDRPLRNGKNRGNLINERRITWKIIDRVCCIEIKNI